ncbi:MAG: hypothetical protein JST65_04445 [Acidobacteria bacterium]|nr:hypothetical protein [Acidobacteriota bacterium]
MSRILRRSHLYLALFLTPWILMYTVSTFVMNHRPEGPRKLPVYRMERELIYPGDLPGAPQDMARQLLSTLDLDGAHRIVRPASSNERLVIERLHATSPRRITYTAADKRVVVERMEFDNTRFLEQMHRRRGYQHEYTLDDLWASSVDLTIAGLLLLALTGMWMWWELRVTRTWGAVALVAGFGLFALFVAVI